MVYASPRNRLQAATPLAELTAVTKLDKLFPVTEVPVADTPLIVYAISGD